MTTPDPKSQHGSRRLQFGLRKLLLWTAVVAVLLGIATTVGIEESSIWLCWTILVFAIRCAFGPKVAGILSVGAPAILMAWFSWVVAVTHHPGPDPGGAIVGGLTLGGLFGLATFGIVEGAVRGVNWVDKVLETKSDGRG